MAPIFSFRRGSNADSEGNYCEDDKYKNQGDGELEHRFFHASPGAIYCIGLAKDAAQAAAPHLKQDYAYQGYRHDYLGYV
jgi:hypothetical protein